MTGLSPEEISSHSSSLSIRFPVMSSCSSSPSSSSSSVVRPVGPVPGPVGYLSTSDLYLWSTDPAVRFPYLRPDYYTTDPHELTAYLDALIPHMDGLSERMRELRLYLSGYWTDRSMMYYMSMGCALGISRDLSHARQVIQGIYGRLEKVSPEPYSALHGRLRDCGDGDMRLRSVQAFVSPVSSASVYVPPSVSNPLYDFAVIASVMPPEGPGGSEGPGGGGGLPVPPPQQQHETSSSSRTSMGSVSGAGDVFGLGLGLGFENADSISSCLEDGDEEDDDDVVVGGLDSPVDSPVVADGGGGGCYRYRRS